MSVRCALTLGVLLLAAAARAQAGGAPAGFK